MLVHQSIISMSCCKAKAFASSLDPQISPNVFCSNVIKYGPYELEKINNIIFTSIKYDACFGFQKDTCN